MIAVPAIAFTLCASRAPQAWPISTEPPAPTPMTSEMKKNTIGNTAEAAASALVPSIWPTKTLLNVPDSACSMLRDHHRPEERERRRATAAGRRAAVAARRARRRRKRSSASIGPSCSVLHRADDAAARRDDRQSQPQRQSSSGHAGLDIGPWSTR